MDEAAYGIGIYTVPEAAAMIHVAPLKLRRWLLGYEYPQGGRKTAQPALWRPQHKVEDGEVLLGFRDVIEARIVNALRSKGIGLPTIRTCMDRAREIVGDAHPFSTRQFKTDGRSIFLEITSDVPEPQLVDLRRRQGVFRHVVLPSLSGLEFGAEAAERWWLLEGKRSIVADPEYAFGQPTVAGMSLTTVRVAQAVKAEGSAARVSKLFDIKQSVVRDALRFEGQRGAGRLH